MKTCNLFVTAAVLAAALSLVSCSKNEPAPTFEGRQLTLTLTLSGDSGTRAVFDENIVDGAFAGLKTKWELGDEISVGVFSTDEFTTFKAVSVSSDGKTATFSGEAIAEWGELTNGTEFWSLYPTAGTVLDWRNQDGKLTNLPDHDFLWVYADYVDGKLVPNDFHRAIYIFRFPKGFAFCDKEVNGDVTLEFSGKEIYSLYNLVEDSFEPAIGEYAIQVGPVSVSAGALNDDVYVALADGFSPYPLKEFNIGVKPKGDNSEKIYKLDYYDGMSSGNVYTITSVSKLQLVAEAVDLNLPSGVKWATCNLGAASPADYGDYFAWGEITGGKTNFSWSTYKWMTEGKSDWIYITKYTFADNYTGGIWYDASSAFVGDNGDGVEHRDLASYGYEDDAAYAALGEKFRMPTDAEWTELREKCTWTWKTTGDGFAANGCLVTGPNGKTIFLPAAGVREDIPYYTDSKGWYWSSSLSDFNSSYARAISFDSGGEKREYAFRYYGFTVRPVCD